MEMKSDLYSASSGISYSRCQIFQKVLENQNAIKICTKIIYKLKAKYTELYRENLIGLHESIDNVFQLVSYSQPKNDKQNEAIFRLIDID